FGARSERANLDLVRDLLRLLGQPEHFFAFVPDRPGHDRRYAIDPTRAERELGWTPLRAHQEALQETVTWYLAHGDWVKRVRTGEYLRYTERMYGRREAWMGSIRGKLAP
ncbi:MAG: GDP-mannose 4,6-dehydratase, partial [Limnochordaceae bacterium]|nr:GDP-mannose 4,6-dehydratase [Limnochordaceae bacterium]